MGNHFFVLIGFFIAALFFLSCKKDNAQEKPKRLEYDVVKEIAVLGPSGLDLTYEEDGFWTVSDETSKVYKLDKNGKVIKEFSVDGKDIEGMAVIDETRLAVVLERTQEVVIVDTNGLELKRTEIDIKSKENSGLEGISYDRKKELFYVLNEKNPRLLLTLDKNLNLLSKEKLNFSDDVSGIYFNENENNLWIVSDESHLVVKTDLKWEPLEKMKIPIAYSEGITMCKSGEKLYIISDDSAALYVFDMK